MMLIEPIKYLDINYIQPVCHATHVVHQIENALRLSAATIEKVLVDEVVPLQKLTYHIPVVSRTFFLVLCCNNWRQNEK